MSYINCQELQKDYQECIDKMPGERMIRNIYCELNSKGIKEFKRGEESLYLINYIFWLKHEIEAGVEQDFEIGKGYASDDEMGEYLVTAEYGLPPFYDLDKSLVPHVDCQSDIEYRMKKGITDELLLDIIDDGDMREVELLNRTDISIEEYRDYINKHYRKPEGDYEKLLYERILGLINCDYCTDYILCYFVFSDEWIENGLADLVIKNLGIEDYYGEFLDYGISVDSYEESSFAVDRSLDRNCSKKKDVLDDKTGVSSKKNDFDIELPFI